MSPEEIAAWEADERALMAAQSRLRERLERDLERFPKSPTLLALAVRDPNDRVIGVSGSCSTIASAYVNGDVTAFCVVMAERAQLVCGAKHQGARLVAAKFLRLALLLKAKAGAQVTRLVRQLAPVARAGALVSIAVIQAAAALVAHVSTATTTWRRAGAPADGWIPPRTTSPIQALAAAPGAPSLAV